MVDHDLRENIDIMITVMSDLDLHLIATDEDWHDKCSERCQDSETKREAAVFWKEMDMKKAVNAAVAAAKQRCETGEIP